MVPMSAPSPPQSSPDGPFTQPACDKGPLVAWKPCELQLPSLPSSLWVGQVGRAESLDGVEGELP